MKPLVRLSLMAIIGSLIPHQAKADFSCQVSAHEYIGLDGAYVLLNIEGKPVKICSFAGNLGDLSADACKVWLSNIMTARAERKAVTLTFHEYQVGGAGTCGQLKAWSASPPFYMEVR